MERDRRNRDNSERRYRRSEIRNTDRLRSRSTSSEDQRRYRRSMSRVSRSRGENPGRRRGPRGSEVTELSAALLQGMGQLVQAATKGKVTNDATRQLQPSSTSRISNQRICIFLANEQLVEEIVTQHKVLTINGIFIEVRRLITPTKRKIFSNVSPIIPANKLDEIVRNLKLVPVSPVTFLRAGVQKYSHILSFRRQIFVQPNDEIELPDSVFVKVGEKNYRIFMTYGDMTCYLCKGQGHIADACPHAQTGQIYSEETNEGTMSQTSNNNSNINTYSNVTKSGRTDEDESSTSESEEILHDNFQTIVELHDAAQNNIAQGGIKRQIDTLSNSSTNVTGSTLLTGSQFKTPFQQPKKKKTDAQSLVHETAKSTSENTPLSVQLAPAESLLKTSSTPQDFRFEKNFYFFENISGCLDSLALARHSQIMSHN
ncbi:hypothetical protein TcasGA2_TC014839 [Tribolium castaneum]|uniref:CCHC-type domain-containing protein n=1 Tax=Tribolium castaneum TaxID=7070 RepID=D2A4E6_TRICA|nr:hypothetical protein TcasGA2_TC014839 [Tribolium castaneum]